MGGWSKSIVVATLGEVERMEKKRLDLGFHIWVIEKGLI
jgi:hypothetical protein